MFGGEEDAVTSERLEVAIVHVKFLTALIHSAPKNGVQQHAVISGFISDIFGIVGPFIVIEILITKFSCILPEATKNYWMIHYVTNLNID